MNIILGIMDQCDTKIDLIRYMWVNDLYFSPVILFNTFNTIRWMNVVLGIMVHCDAMIDLIKYM